MVCPKKSGLPSLIWGNFKNVRKVLLYHSKRIQIYWMMKNFRPLKSKIEIQKGAPKNSVVLQNWLPQEIRSPLFNLRKFQKPGKSTAEWYRKHGNVMNDEEFGSFQILKLKQRMGVQIIQPFCRINSPQEIRSCLINLMNFQKVQKSATVSCRTHWNLMNDKEFGCFKLLKLKCRKGDQIIQAFYRIGSRQEIRSFLIKLMNFQKGEKSTAKSCRMNWNLMNDKEFGSFKLVKLKYKKGDQIIQSFCRIGSLQEIRSPFVNLSKFQKAEKSTAEWCRRHWNLMNDEEFGSFKFVKLK